jgi:hypothetical protein
MLDNAALNNGEISTITRSDVTRRPVILLAGAC